MFFFILFCLKINRFTNHKQAIDIRRDLMCQIERNKLNESNRTEYIIRGRERERDGEQVALFG